MTELSQMARHEQPPAPAGLTERPLTLAEEHALLLRQVAARAEDLLTTAAYGRAPAAELEALAGYTRAEVLRQVSDEEALLFPTAPSQDITSLARDHARLRSAAELLERVAAGEQSPSAAQVASVVRDFVVQLERHLQTEEALLAARWAQQAVPSTMALGGHVVAEPVLAASPSLSCW